MTIKLRILKYLHSKLILQEECFRVPTYQSSFLLLVAKTLLYRPVCA